MLYKHIHITLKRETNYKGVILTEYSS